MPNTYLTKILKARVYDVARETPLDPMPLLSTRIDNKVLLKREDLQPVFSFKLRGAYNRMSMLNAKQKAAGVIAASAGNHAQGVALSAKIMAIKATIVMPATTPGIKVNAVRRHGGRVVLHGDTYDEAYAEALRLAEEQSLTLVPPYDDPDVIAGQGTIAMEILRQHGGGDIHAVFIPVGGGGLIAGMSAYIKGLYPKIRVIGVEPDDAPCMARALEAGRRVTLDQVGIFADGVAVRQVGKEPFRVARQCVDEVILVSSDEICAAIKDIFDDTRSIAEPAGALAVAGMKRYVSREGMTDQALVAIDSGANVNFDRLRHVSERAELGEGREVLFAVTIPERPGSFLRFCRAVGKRGVTEFNYRYADAADAQIFVGVKMGGEDEKEAFLTGLKDKGYALLDLTDNEMAKLHISHMVGGRASGVHDERIFRFEFPERPGALLTFLQAVGRQWNISLFHYRNHGAANGQVLAGLQIPAGEESAFKKFMDDQGYDYWDESDNPAYTLFLS